MSNVEIVEYRGIRFRRYPDAKRWTDRAYFRATGYGLLHRVVYRDTYGPVPLGHDVHHADKNPGNNESENLVAVPKGKHQADHNAQLSDAERKRRKFAMAKVREKADNWHGSPEGLAWHREHGKRTWEGRGPINRACEWCGSEYQTIAPQGHDRFCSNKCKSAWRRASGVDDEQRFCIVCGAAFTVNKYAKSRTCSRSCGYRGRGL